MIFFNSIDIAIALKHYITSHTDKYNYKPAERFTNPIMLNIPTIGYYEYESFKYYGTDFLCTNLDCIEKIIDGIVLNNMNKTFYNLRKNVLYQLDINNIRRVYNELFYNTMSCGMYQPINNNFLSYIPITKEFNLSMKFEINTFNILFRYY